MTTTERSSTDATSTDRPTDARTEDKQSPGRSNRRRIGTRFSILIRRMHMYAGLLLMPWVLLYGVTGAMYNHQGLFPEAKIEALSASEIADTSVSQLPAPEELAQQVVTAIQAKAPHASIQLPEQVHAEYNNPVILLAHHEGKRITVQIDPIEQSARVAELADKETLQEVLPKIRNIQLDDNPYESARAAVPAILKKTGRDFQGDVQPRGWCKLNFVAKVNDDPVRITYVLRDGHVDMTQLDGNDGMTARQFFLRLHTTHGQPPHWNGRMVWSVIVDIMAISMVAWVITGLIMWWQIKRTRWLGLAAIATSVAAAFLVYANMHSFYALTKL